MNYNSEAYTKIKAAKELINEAVVLLFEAQTASGKYDFKTSYLDNGYTEGADVQTSDNKRQSDMKIQFLFAWYDLWVGVFIYKAKRKIYVFPNSNVRHRYNFQAAMTTPIPNEGAIPYGYMRGLITHEESQEVAMAFNRLPNHHFFSNDLKPCSGGYPVLHFQQDCFECLDQMWNSIGIDFLGMHPDCTFLTNAGIRWLTSLKPRTGYQWSEKYQVYINPDRWRNMEQACEHFKKCHKWLLKVGKGYIENPRMHPYAMEIIGIPSTQYIHPYYFGTPQMKETHYWLVGLDPLKPTNMIIPPKDKRERLKWQNVWMASPGPKRKEIRSKTDSNVAKAKAQQWG